MSKLLSFQYVIKIKIEIFFIHKNSSKSSAYFILIAYISRAQKPPVANGYHIGQHRYKPMNSLNFQMFFTTCRLLYLSNCRNKIK